MKTINSPTDFARCVTRFLTSYLPGERNLSPQTIKSYSLALKMYIVYLDSVIHIKPERIELKDVTVETMIGFFLEMGEAESISPKLITNDFRLLRLSFVMQCWSILRSFRTVSES
ncbi:MAG: hypothetical protein FWH26_11250 [Oscillospiraceae bacterium]|nr:hypothetical protein [Oscillospiraceae bacterium]